MSYISYDKLLLEPDQITEEQIETMYNNGFVFTRDKKWKLNKIRSGRINLENFETSSENRRILRKFNADFAFERLPYKNYIWEIHKLGVDFYNFKFGKDIFSANKIKELFEGRGSFNSIMEFRKKGNTQELADGYVISFITRNICHYAYPFYSVELINSNFGMYMMTYTAMEMKKMNFKYIYIGSLENQKSLYKTQFKGFEWFDETNNVWSTDIQLLKSKIRHNES